MYSASRRYAVLTMAVGHSDDVDPADAIAAAIDGAGRPWRV